MKKTSIFLLVLISFYSCEYIGPLTKKQYLEHFQSFVIDAEERAEFLSDQDWQESDEKYEKFALVYYQKFKADLTDKDRKKINLLKARYRGLKFKLAINDFFKGIKEGYIIAKQGVGLFVDAVKERLKPYLPNFDKDGTDDDKLALVMPLPQFTDKEFIEVLKSLVEQVENEYKGYQLEDWEIIGAMYITLTSVYETKHEKNMSEKQQDSVIYLQGKFKGFLFKWATNNGALKAGELWYSFVRTIKSTVIWFRGFIEAFEEDE